MHSKTVSVLLLGATFSLCLAIVFLFFQGGAGLGFLLTVLVAEGSFCSWLWLPRPRLSALGRSVGQEHADMGIRPGLPLMAFVIVAILDLSFCYFLYDNFILKLVGFPVIMGLLVIQYLFAARVFRHDWDRPGFWTEAALSVIVRPFDGLGGFGRTVAGLFARRHAEEADISRRNGPTTFAKILLGLVLAIPVLLVSGALLTSADPVFAQLFGTFRDWLSGFFTRDVPVRLLVSLLLLPFVFSFLYSGRNRPPLIAPSTEQNPSGYRADRTVLATFLFCVNALYLVFALVQLTYLTGAFSARLPGHMTYAEYARNGFFELSAVSVVNLGLSVLAVKLTDRNGSSGRIVRIASLLLVFFSLIQWGSAMFRMRMYIQAYGLSRLRFFVTAFMLLMLVFFAAVVVKEFRKGFPFFKACAIAAVVSLMLLNHLNPDAWIARTNIHRHTEIGRIDMTYLDELSSDAVPALFELTDSADPDIRREVAVQLIDRYKELNEPDPDQTWQETNLSRIRAEKQLASRLEELRNITRIG